ncbi:hypothetical protein ACFPES_28825 [Paenibacillus sp. GCM10023248]|uniref:hypothetical protein n=1 Tax=Bacillales TaxID=1385 RepID=UPI00237870C1|nr:MULTISPECIES: hypothetical protein [Bacillales]MDD9271058.1 hypothetical protein [Paenibacillus sp. MAHUQ-63]MDR6882804.1 hypothetical protein [Bacillus sp. 3255]
MKNFVPIFFEFEKERDALLALDTLEELGYKPELLEGERSTLHIHLDDQEMTSALEIAQAHGGRLVERQPEQQSEASAYAMAYDLEGSIRIPAHTVNEDWPDGYAASTDADAVPSDEEAAFDPSSDDYNHFSAGIRI